jgi:hypothetical protein
MRNLIAIVAIVAISAGFAIAQPGFGRGYGPCGGGAPCGGPGVQGGIGGQPGTAPCWNGQQPEVLTDADAQAKVDQYLQQYLKGFKVIDTQEYQVPRGTMRLFTVEDANGNRFNLHLNPWGYVRGPFPYQEIK